MSAQVLGTRGRADLLERRKGLQIKTQGGTWTYSGPQNQMYQTEHDELFASIRTGKPINNGEYMAWSTLMAIMGRMAAYTGQEITWEMARKSKEDLSPSRYAWDGQPPAAQIAVPGQTRFGLRNTMLSDRQPVGRKPAATRQPASVAHRLHVTLSAIDRTTRTPRPASARQTGAGQSRTCALQKCGRRHRLWRTPRPGSSRRGASRRS